MICRQVSIHDLDQVAVLFDQYRQFYDKESNIAAAANFLKDRILKAESILFIVIDGKEVVGFTQLYPLFSSTRLCKIWQLNDLFVQPDHRQKGIARMLI